VQSEDQQYGYRPIAEITFAIEHQVFGLNPMLSHLVNLFFYLIIGLLIFYFLVSSFTSQHWSIHLIITLLFLAHPIHTEVVASLKNREELLSFMFGLGVLVSLSNFKKNRKYSTLFWPLLLISLAILSKKSALIFVPIMVIGMMEFWSFSKIKSLTLIRISSTNSLFRIPIWIKISYFLFVATYLLKFNSLTKLFHISTLLLGYGLLFYSVATKRFNKSNSSSWIPFVILLLGFNALASFSEIPTIKLLMALYFLVTLIPSIISHFNLNIKNYLDYLKNYIGYAAFIVVAVVMFFFIYQFFITIPEQLLPGKVVILTQQQNPLFNNLDHYQALLFSIKTIETYFIMLIYPAKQLFYYGFNMIPIPYSLSFEMVLILLLHAGLALLGFFSVKFNSLVAFAIGIYFFGLGLFSNLFLPITGIVGERLMFIPSFGFIILLVVGLFKVFNVSISNPEFKTRRGIALLAILISGFSFYSFKTINRNSNWKSRINLFTADIPYLKNSARANLIIADEIHQQSLNKLRASQALTPDIVAAFEDAAFYYQQAYNVDTTAYTALNNLGHIQFTYLEKPQAAISTLTKGLNLRKNNYQLTNNLGKIYENTGNLKMAYKYYLQTKNLRPEFVPVWSNLGIYHFKMNNVDSAIFYLSKVLNAEPNHPEEAEILGDIMVQKKDIQNALNFYNFAAQLNPSNNILITKIENLK